VGDMQIFIIVALVIAGVAIVFALQNFTAVTVTFLFWNLHASLALVLLLSVAVGVVISLLASLPGLIRGKWGAAGQKKKLASLNTENSANKQRADEAEKEIKTLEEQLANLSAALEQAEASLDSKKPLA
jgi:lipopolysaccharide assembly protein A